MRFAASDKDLGDMLCGLVRRQVVLVRVVLVALVPVVLVLMLVVLVLVLVLVLVALVLVVLVVVLVHVVKTRRVESLCCCRLLAIIHDAHAVYDSSEYND